MLVEPEREAGPSSPSDADLPTPSGILGNLFTCGQRGQRSVRLLGHQYHSLIDLSHLTPSPLVLKFAHNSSRKPGNGKSGKIARWAEERNRGGAGKGEGAAGNNGRKPTPAGAAGL